MGCCWVAVKSTAEDTEHTEPKSTVLLGELGDLGGSPIPTARLTHDA